MIAKISDFGSDIGQRCDKNIGHWIGSEKPHRFSPSSSSASDNFKPGAQLSNRAENFQTGR